MAIINYTYDITSSANSYDAAAVEGTPVLFTIFRSSSGTASTIYIDTDTTNETATGNVDYASSRSVKLNFGISDSYKTYSVSTYIDSLSEGSEYFYLLLFTAPPDFYFDYKSYAFGWIKDQGDTIAPVLTTITPSPSATAVGVGDNCVMTFSEAVKAGSGSFVVKTGSTTVATIAVTDTSQVTFSGATVTINPTNDLAYGTSYSVEVAEGVIKDLAGNSWVGASSYQFTTGFRLRKLCTTPAAA